MKRLALLTLLVALLCLALVGPVATAQQKVKITMWTHDNLYVQFFTDRANEWKEKYPQYDFDFEFTQVPYDQLFTKVIGNLAAGFGAPDLVGIEISAFSRFMKGGIAEKGLAPLTKYIGSEEDDFIRWGPYTYKGNIYGVESGLSPVVYYYREDLFDEAGIETPIKTWEEFYTIGQKLGARGMHMAPIESNGATVFMELFQQRGGKLFDEDGQLTLDDPRAVQTLDFLVRGANDGVFWATSEFYDAPPFAAMKQDKVAGVIMPDWYSVYYLKPNLPEQDGQWRVQLLPAWGEGGRRASTWGGTGFAITSQSKHPDLVWDLLHYTYMTLENQIKRFREIQYFPTMKAAFHHPDVIEVPDPFYGGQRFGGILAEAAAQIPIQYQSPYWNEAMTVLTNEITVAMAGDKTPEQAIKDAVAGIQKMMR